MAGKTRLISAPPARGGDDRRGYIQLSGSMGAMAPSPNDPPPSNGAAEKFESDVVPDTAWERTVAMREMQEGLRATAQTQHPPYEPDAAHTNSLIFPSPVKTTPVKHIDLSSLPERFQLEIERKGDRWKITAPAVHNGLWKSGEDLSATMGEALATLAEMVRLDGIQPAVKRGRKTR